jgi:hypothetical protein
MLGDAIMSKWWMGLALAAVVAGQPNSALAQYPEPAPCGPSCMGGSMAAGPLQPNQAPSCPGPDLSLPANVPNAFSHDEYCHQVECYLGFGSIMLQAGRPYGHKLIAFEDPGGGVKTGIRPTDPAVLSNTALDFSAFVPDFEFGISGTIGVAIDDWAIEASGYYVPLQGRTKTVDSPGLLDLPFVNAPLGFEGAHGLWLQADRVKLMESFALIDGEVNVKCACGCFVPLIGVRYLDVKERMSIFTGEDDLTVLDVNGNPDPTTQATYRITQHDRIVAGQLGFELRLPIWKCLVFVGSAKGAWGANFYEKTTTLFRGDGLLGFEDHERHTQFSHIYDVGLFLELYLKERCRIRAGYDFLWLVDVPLARDQIDFDLSNPAGMRNDHGTQFFHGPQL